MLGDIKFSIQQLEEFDYKLLLVGTSVKADKNCALELDSVFEPEVITKIIELMLQIGTAIDTAYKLSNLPVVDAR